MRTQRRQKLMPQPLPPSPLSPSSSAAATAVTDKDATMTTTTTTTTRTYHTVTLRVTGMMCQKNCGTTVGNALMSIPGATSAEASFEYSRATVTADLSEYQKKGPKENISKLISRLEEEAVDAVECVGFDAEIMTEQEMEEQNEAMEKQSSIATTTSSSLTASSCSPPSINGAAMQEHDPEENNTDIGATFQVGGMSCAVCSGRVEKALKSVNGVASASVTLAMNRARISCDSTTTQQDDLEMIAQACVQAVQKEGYECDLIQLHSNNENDSDHGISLRENAAKMEQARLAELSSWRRLLMVSLVFTIPLMVLHYSHSHKLGIMLVLSSIVQLGVGRRYYSAAYKSWPVMGMDSLIVMGTTAAYAYSVVAFVIMLFSPTQANLRPTFETGAMLLTFVTFGKFLEAYAKGKTAYALQKLLQLQPVLALKVMDEVNDDSSTDLSSLSTQEVSIEQVAVGDYLLVMPGGRIPADGVLVATSHSKSGGGGGCYIDESALSGEPFPVCKHVGDSVFGSTVNQLSALIIKVTATGSHTVLAKICKLVEEAQSNRAPIQAQADKIASIFCPTVFVLAALTFTGWMVFGSSNFSERFLIALTSAISVVVASCPCALGLATPTAVMVGTGVGATHGLLIKGGAVLECAHSVDTVVLDKTGTVTTGQAIMGDNVEFVSEGDALLEGVPTKVKHNIGLWLAACAEKQSEHPLARAICNAASGKWGGDVTCAQDGVQVSRFEVMPGMGVECVVSKPNWGTHVVRVGSKRFVHGASAAADSEPLYESSCSSTGDEEVMQLRNRGQVGIYVSIISETNLQQGGQWRVVGVFGIVDPIVPEARSTVAALRRMGVSVWLCTGDHELTALSVARQVGIDEDNVCAGVSPQGKADLVSRLQKQDRNTINRRAGFSFGRKRFRRRHCGGRVAVVGDGINDSIALARADVGVAIGAGTEIAVEAADVVLVKSSLHDVVVALHLSRVVFDRIRLNFLWAMGYNLCALPFAAGALYPITNWRLPPEFAGLLMAFSSVSVVTSSLLLRTYSKPVICDDGKLKGSGLLSTVSKCTSNLKARLGPRSLLNRESDIEYDDLAVSSDDEQIVELV